MNRSALRDHAIPGKKLSTSFSFSAQKKEKRGCRGRKKRRTNPYDPLHCPRCNTVLGRKSSLVRHLKAHNEAKPYTCGKCGRRFQEKGQLKRHDQVHTGVKPFPCQNCGKCYSDNVNLKKHQQSCTTFIKVEVTPKIEEETKKVVEVHQFTPPSIYDWMFTQQFLEEQGIMFNLLRVQQARLWANYVAACNNRDASYNPSQEMLCNLELMALRSQIATTETDLEKIVNGFFNDKM